MPNKVYVIGHKNPDTDSVCAAVGYAYLKNALSKGTVYEPKKAGALNAETRYVLERFGVEEPETVTNVGTQLTDIEYRNLDPVDGHISLKQAWEIMLEKNVATLPVVGRTGKLEGVIVNGDIAYSYMDVYDNSILSRARTQYSNIISTLNGTLVTGNPHAYFVKGSVVIASSNREDLMDDINRDDLVYREIIVNQNVPGKGRHPLARYLSGKSKKNTNEDNIKKTIDNAKKMGNSLNDLEVKVLKYIYVLTKINKIPITAMNIASIFVPNKKNEKEDVFKGKEGEQEKNNMVATTLRKLVVAGIVKEKDGVYELVGNYNDSEAVMQGHIPNQFFRTTKEMMNEFEFLNDKDLIKEIVVTNPNKIIDMLDIIEVVIYHDKPYSPIIEHSQEICRDLVFDKAHSMYGDPLPPNIEERIAQEFYGDKINELVEEKIRIDNPDMSDEEVKEIFTTKLHEIIMSGYDGVVELKKEQVLRNSDEELSDEEARRKAKDQLTGIIGGGFDVIYLIAQKLVKHSNDDGYLVGSRGSVGSSFVASMMGITECNGLPAHYYCPKCQHSEFNDENGVAYSENYPSGFDLPEKKCPKCGEVMIH